MKLDLRGVGVGVTPDGVWMQRQPDGSWATIERPAWADKPNTNSRARATFTLTMTDPQEREETEVVMVTVRRVVTKTVPDYEAEVLIRNGWEYDTG